MTRAKDPRGPDRTITHATRDGETLKWRIVLSCGHTPDLNAIYTYRVGDLCHCFACVTHPDNLYTA